MILFSKENCIVVSKTAVATHSHLSVQRLVQWKTDLRWDIFVIQMYNQARRFMRSNGMYFEKINQLKYLRHAEEVKYRVIWDGDVLINYIFFYPQPFEIMTRYLSMPHLDLSVMQPRLLTVLASLILITEAQTKLFIWKHSHKWLLAFGMWATLE